MNETGKNHLKKALSQTPKQAVANDIMELSRNANFENVKLLNGNDVEYGSWKGYEASFTATLKNSPVYRSSVQKRIELKNKDDILGVRIDEFSLQLYSSPQDWKYKDLYKEILSTLQFHANSKQGKK